MPGPARAAETGRGDGGRCRWCGAACPPARLPFEDPRVVAAIGSTLVATSLLRRRLRSSALREGVVQALGVMPAMVALSDRDLAAYHGVEHKAIAAYEQGVEDPATVPKEHDRCGSNLVAPMMLLSAGGTRPARAPGREPRAARPRRRRPRRRLARGRDVRLERSPPRRAPGRGLPHARTRDPAPPGDQGADPRAARGRRSPRWPRSFASRAHRLRADVRTDRPHRRRRRGPRRRPRALREAPSRCRSRTARRSSSRASRRCCSTSATGTSSCCGRSGPRPRSASSSSARAPACTTSPTPSTTSTRPWRSSPPPASS